MNLADGYTTPQNNHVRKVGKMLQPKKKKKQFIAMTIDEFFPERICPEHKLKAMAGEPLTCCMYT